MKKNTKLIITLILAACICIGLCSCGKKEPGDAVIIFTNDTHTSINNIVETKEDGTNVYGLSFASVVAMKKDLEADGNTVFLVDSGDHSQGSAFGAFDEAKSIIEIMNKTGYDAATLGNHEFDYGQFRTFGIMDSANFPYVSCGFVNAGDKSPVLPPYTVVEKNGVKIAFVGISTPETATKAAPVYFQDEKGNKIYDFLEGEDGTELFAVVQEAIDAAKKEADYVIGLSHLGVDISSAPCRSTDLIAHTSGFDAVIDGHSHTKIEGELVNDKDGNPVLLTQTGGYFKGIGKLTIKDGSFSSEIISEYEGRDEEVEAMETALKDAINEKFGEKIADNKIDLRITDPDGSGTRLIRRMETNLGDLVPDGYYYYFNEIEGLNCDVALMNGGGIRADIPAGEMSYATCQTISPFGNVICMVAISGQELLDTLEWGARYIGLVVDGKIAENGGFFHTAGLTFTIDSTIESSVAVTEDGAWGGAPGGEYKVKDVKVYDKKTGSYQPLELDRIYTVCGSNFTLRNGGDGNIQLMDAKLVKDFVGEDYYILAQYIKAFAPGEGGMPILETKNSPLMEYPGYLLDYENPMGSGRITIE